MTRPTPAEAGAEQIVGTIGEVDDTGGGVHGEGRTYAASPIKRARRTKAEMELIRDAIVEAVELDWPVSVRGVFYRLVGWGVVPKDEKRGYNTVQQQLVKLRRDGIVPYERIADGTRWIVKPETWDSPADALRATANFYRRDLWSRSSYKLMIFSEKDAISGVVSPVLEKWDVALGIVRGYSSFSFAWSVAQGLDPLRRNVIAQLGDHDPSGVHAWEDFSGKVRDLASPTVDVSFERLAVTPRQIEEFGLPTRPTKKTDSRSRGWEGESVEVDAIAPSDLRDLVDEFVSVHVDADELRHLELVEQLERDQLADMAEKMGKAW